MLAELIIAMLLAATPWVELLVVVPLGIGWGIAPIPLAIAVIIGNTVSLLPVLWLYTRWRDWRAARKARRENEPSDHRPADAPTNAIARPDPVSDSETSPTPVLDSPAASNDAAVEEAAADAVRDDSEIVASQEEFSTRRGARVRRLWQKYGLPGVAFLAPLVTGVHLAAGFALLAGATRRDVFLWFTTSIILWTIGLTVVSALGMEGLRLLWESLRLYFGSE